MNTQAYRTLSARALATDARRGAAMVIVICIALVLIIGSMTMVTISSNAMHRVQRNMQNMQSLGLAEAGVADMIARLETNYYQWQNATNTGSLGANGITGTYYVVSQFLTNNGHVLITSTGTVNGLSRGTVLELLGTTHDHNNDIFSLDGVMLGGVLIAFSTAAFDLQGNAHCNGNITSDSGAKNGAIHGTVSAVGTIGDLTAEAIQAGADAKELPTFNFNSYRTLAISNGIYYSNAVSLSGINFAPSNGVMYVNGNCTISGNSDFTGTLVANGDITINNNFWNHIFEGHTNWPSMLSTGTITINNNETYEGIIYAAVNVIVANHVTVHGGIITPGTISVQNHLELSKPSGYPPWDPLAPATAPEVIVGGWLR